VIKRNSRNIGKVVEVVNLKPEWNGRRGKVVGFRGDHEKGVPYVNVFVYSIGSVWPVSGKFLKEVKHV